jgi:transposase InsO family protein
MLTPPRSPWQNAYVERFIGSARRECLDHVLVFNATGLQRLMKRYCAYCAQSRTHLSLNKDYPSPDRRAGGWSRRGDPAARRASSPIRPAGSLTRAA